MLLNKRIFVIEIDLFRRSYGKIQLEDIRNEKIKEQMKIEETILDGIKTIERLK